MDNIDPVVTYDRDMTKCTSYGPGTSASVALCVTDNKMQCWPGQGLGQCGSEIGSGYIWEFFKNHNLGGHGSPYGSS